MLNLWAIIFFVLVLMGLVLKINFEWCAFGALNPHVM